VSSVGLVKLSGNFLGASVIEALGEALALVAKSGIDQGQYLEFLTSTLFDAPIYKTYGALICQRAFCTGRFCGSSGAEGYSSGLSRCRGTARADAGG
jgi:3-hydroxyisobutyrate dehydrogenase-like beta-hydroxyacid dehydrogenase